MIKFSISKIKNKTVGEILEETRREQNLSLLESAEATRIHVNHLSALETDEHSKLPGGVYSEKILETYADFLNIDFNYLKKLFIRESQISRKTTDKTFVPKISLRHFIVTTRLIKIGAAILAILGLLIYLGFEINNIFSPPSLDIFIPIDNLITDKPNIEIAGQTEKEVKIKINDQEIQSDKNGYFKESISLKNGLNVIKVSAAKKRSKDNIVYRRVILTNNN